MREMYATNASDKDITFSDVRLLDERSIVQKVRLKVFVRPEFRFASNAYWKHVIRRAAYRSDVPLTKRSVRMDSDKVKRHNWIAGVDYIEFGLLHRAFRSQADLDTAIVRMNRELVEFGMTLLDGDVVAADVDSLRKAGELSLYEISTARNLEHVRNSVAAFHKADYVEMVLRKEVYRAGVVSEIVNAKDFVHDLWAVRDGLDVKLRMLIRGVVTPLDVYPAVFKRFKTEALSQVVVKLDSFVQMEDAQMDFFRKACEACGRVIPVNYLDKPYDPHTCPKCSDLVAGRVL
jgi:hypothetical protein